MQTTTNSPHDAPLALIADLAGDLAARACEPAGDAPAPGEAPLLSGVARLLGALDRLMAAVVVALVNADHRRVIAEEGVTAESWLRAVARRTGADAVMLVAASERLADMPATLGAFTAGTLSWGTVRGIVSAVKSLTGDQRGWVDETLAGDRERLARLDSDSVVATADRLANAVRPDLEQQRTDRAAGGQRLMFQPAMDGTGTAFAAMDAETFATVQQAIETLTHDATGRRVTSNVEALRAMARQRLARTGTQVAESGDSLDHATAESGATAQPETPGPVPSDGVTVPNPHPGGAPSTARPEMLIITDISLLAGSADDSASTDRSSPDTHPSGPITRTPRGIAELLWRTNRPTPTLTSDAVRRLACDATLRPVLVDGCTILGTAEPYAKVSAALRAALTARDGGCRFPACHGPADVCDAHHIVHRVDNGPTVLDNLALLCSAHHRAVHEGGWRAELHADGSMTFARRGVSLRSVTRAAAAPTPDRPPPRGRRTRGPSQSATPAAVGSRRTRSDDARPTVDHAPGGAPPQPVASGDAAFALPF